MLAVTIMAPHLKKGQGTNPHRLFPFPWDSDDRSVKPVTAEDMEMIDKLEQFRKRDIKRWKDNLKKLSSGEI